LAASASVLPRDTQRTRMWLDGGFVSLRRTSVERPAVNLNNACVAGR
jgi:hypothetical protein